MSEESLFESIIDGVSNDRFLMFIEQYTHALISPLSAKHLRWCVEPSDDELNGVASSSMSLEGPASSPTSLFQFTQKHFEVFQTYQLMFEARISSVLKKTTDGAISSERFFEICARILSEKSASRITAELDDVNLNDTPGSADKPILVADLCEALLDMVDAVSSFQTFATLMADRQRKLIVDSNTTASSGDDE
jgi:hypothetical protein